MDLNFQSFSTLQLSYFDWVWTVLFRGRRDILIKWWFTTNFWKVFVWWADVKWIYDIFLISLTLEYFVNNAFMTIFAGSKLYNVYTRRDTQSKLFYDKLRSARSHMVRMTKCC